MSIVNVELLCDGCKNNLLFPASTVGTIQECPHCGGPVSIELPDELESENSESDHEAESERQWTESARQLEMAKQHLEETTRQLEEGGRQLQTTARLQGQIEESIANFNRFMNRCEQLLERFEKVLGKFDGH
jgi:hypothetical protein